jgi:hypothetical protein
MFTTHAADIEFTTAYMNAFKSDREIHGMGMGNVCAAASLISETARTREALLEKWQNGRDHLKFLSIIATAPPSMQKPMHDWCCISDFYPSFTNIHFNRMRFVNEMILNS